MKALVCNKPGLPTPGESLYCLAAQGRDAFRWMIFHRAAVREFEATLTPADVGRLVDLPLRH